MQATMWKTRNRGLATSTSRNKKHNKVPPLPRDFHVGQKQGRAPNPVKRLALNPGWAPGPSAGVDGGGPGGGPDGASSVGSRP